MSSSSSESDQYEDAQEVICVPTPPIRPPPPSSLSILNNSNNRNRQSSQLLKNWTTPTGIECNTPPQINLFPATPCAVSPSQSNGGRIGEATNTTRRDRLSVLRGRMRTEFGGAIEYTDDGETSENTSLASWGRNLLLEHESTTNGGSYVKDDIDRPIIYANDSASTRGHITVIAASNAISLPSSQAPTLPPPPTRPRAATTAIVVAPTPPPLPPRPAIMTNPLPTFVSNSTVTAAASLSSNQSSTSDASSGTSSKSSTLDSNQQQQMHHSPYRVHHAKSNSLDRGLSGLFYRSGPFPPTNSKTNSLSREFSLNAAMIAAGNCNELTAPAFVVDQTDESQRHSDAVDVIEEITNRLLDESELSPATTNPIANVSSSRSGRLSVVEERASPESINAAQSIAGRSTDIKSTKPVVTTSASQPIKPPRLIKNDKLPTRSTPQLDEVNSIDSQRKSTHSHHRRNVSQSSATYHTLSSQREFDLVRDRESRYVMDRMLSIDPITKDVQRRMSIKEHHRRLSQEYSTNTAGTSKPFASLAHARMAAETSSLSSIDTDQTSVATTTATSTLNHAKSIVSGYGRIATKLVRRVYDRARHIGTTTPSKLDAQDDDDDEMRSEKSESMNDGQHNDGVSGGIDDERMSIVDSVVIVRSKNAKKGPFDFEQLRLAQDLSGEHSGAVWCLKFSLCGRLLASAGQDNIIRIWVLRSHHAYFNTMRERYNLQSKRAGAVNNESAGVLQKTLQDLEKSVASSTPSTNIEQLDDGDNNIDVAGGAANDCSNTDASTLFATKPFCTYRGHTADVLDLSWSKNYFILSSGMDRTVRLWHVSRLECLCCFQHMDFVTCIAFLPKDDRYFLSGSLDGKLRLWHIPDKKVALWNEVEQSKLITAMTFVKNGKFAVVGTYNGRCIFYSTDQLKYHTVIDVRSTRGKNARGHKVTGLAVHGDKLLITSNDSRVRMYDLRDMALTCKYKGASNERSQIRASFSPDGRHIICGSEDRYIYLWRMAVDSKDSLAATLSVRKDRNAMWERVRGHSHIVTAAIFAPKPQLILAQIEQTQRDNDALQSTIQQHQRNNSGSGKTIVGGDVIVSADLNGSIRVMVNRTRIHTASSVFFPTD